MPLIIIVLAQLQMAINISVLPVSLGPISEDFDAPATATATTLLVYSLSVAAFVMLGAKIGKLVGYAFTPLERPKAGHTNKEIGKHLVA